jgi:uncharacterized membrane protein
MPNRDRVIVAVVFLAAIGRGLAGGVFYAFSSFVMAALGRLPPAHGASAMNEINVTVINLSFMTVFMGTTIACLGLLGGWYFWRGTISGRLILAASLVYLIGSFGVTMAGNVPLNNELAAATPAQQAAVWTRFLDHWTVWNHVRTAASTLSAALFTAALILA